MRTLSGIFLPFKYKYQKPCDKYPSVKYLEQKAFKGLLHISPKYC